MPGKPRWDHTRTHRSPCVWVKGGISRERPGVLPFPAQGPLPAQPHLCPAHCHPPATPAPRWLCPSRALYQGSRPTPLPGLSSPDVGMILLLLELAVTLTWMPAHPKAALHTAGTCTQDPSCTSVRPSPERPLGTHSPKAPATRAPPRVLKTQGMPASEDPSPFLPEAAPPPPWLSFNAPLAGGRAHPPFLPTASAGGSGSRPPTSVSLSVK